jgi:Zn-dependent protease
MLFGSVWLHELGHSVVALLYKVPVRSITLFLFGGVAQIGAEPTDATAEFLIAIAGPLVSLGLVVLFTVLKPAFAGIRTWRTDHSNTGLSEWQLMSNLAKYCFLLCSEYVTANRAGILSFLAHSSAPRTHHPMCRNVRKSCKHNALTEIRRCWPGCCYKIL